MNEKRLPTNFQSNLLDIQQVAEFLGISKDTVYKMVNQRRIPFVKVGRLLRFERGTLEAWLQRNAFGPLTPRDRKQMELPKE
ncbi:MAG: helix-turn-helix domain-containing protein [Nitrospirae bacterium]|nr:helix-turn-helix domain-containing protein [Nitrospirota bacterium]